MQAYKIDKIEPSIYIGEVCNIEVEEDNSYVTESFVVHNCDPTRTGDKFFDITKVKAMLERATPPTKTSGLIRQWDVYNPSHRYGAGEDLSDGIGKDSCAFAMFDFKQGKLVVSADDNLTPPDLFTYEAIRVCGEFGNCIFAPETNNTCGGIAVRVLKEEQYPNIYQKEVTDKVNNVISTILGWHTNRKSLVHGTGVLTKEGYKNIECIKIGDSVYGSDGKLHNVTGVYPQGMLDVWEVETSDGAKIKCSPDHLWNIKSKYYKDAKARTFKTEELKDDKNKYFIERASPILFEEKKLPIDPYFLGLLLGDGSFSASIGFSTVDEEIVDSIKDVLEYPLRITKCKNTHCDYYITRPRKGFGRTPNPLQLALTELNIRETRSHNKFVPEIYKQASIEQRYEILRGLMDTDGTIGTQHLKPSFTSISERLANDVRDLVLSLGGYAKVSYYKNDFNGFYTTSIQTPDNPFRLKRKADLYNQRTNRKRRRNIVSVKELNYKAPMTCISIDSNDELYITEDYLLTHNTKPDMFYEFKKDFNDGLIEIPDERVLKEMLAFTKLDLQDARSSAITRHFDLLTAVVIAYKMKDHAGGNEGVRDFYANMQGKRKTAQR